MAPDFGGRPFSLSHYIAVKSAIELNKPQEVIFHYEFEPQGEWWQRIKPYLTLNQVKAPTQFMGREIIHVAHRADVVRLQALRDTGGIYLDLDTICAKPLTDLLHHKFVIGKELKAPYVPKNWRQELKYSIRKRLGLIPSATEEAGLCNAVLLSEKDSTFVNLWLQEYKSFRSRGRDKYWNEHSVVVPEQLARQYPQHLTIVGPYAFHYPLYHKPGLRSMFEEVTSFPDAYLHHVWESFSWNDYLCRLTVDDIQHHDTTYNLLARKII